MLVNQQQQPFRVKLIDFGASLTTEQLSSMWKPYIQPRCYRAPEVLLGLPCCEKIDIWSLGCMMAELDTGSILFPGKSELEVAHRIFECRGLPSAHLINSSSKARKFFHVVVDPNGSYQLELYKIPPWSMSQNFKRCKVTSLDQLVTVEDPEPGFQRDDAAEIADRKCMVDLLKKMLTVDPRERISARQALHHPFLTLQHLRVAHSYRQYYKYSVQGYKEALVPYQDSMDGEHVPSQETSDHTQENCSLQRFLRSLFTCACVCRSPSAPHNLPVLQDNNVSVEETGNAENPEDLADNMADTDHAPCEEMEKEHSLLAIDHSQMTLQQGYQEAVIPQQPSREEHAGCAFQPRSKSSSMEPQGPLVIVPNHNQELPKKEKGSLRSLQSLFTCFRVRWHKKRPVTSQNNDSQGDSGNAETHEDLAHTDHTACDKVEKEHQLSAIDDRQTMLQQGYQVAVIPQQLSREEDAGCSFRSPSRSSSMKPQVSSVPSDINCGKSDLDCTQNLETSNQVFSREEDTGCAFQPQSKSSSMEHQGSLVMSGSSPVDIVPNHYQEFPKKKKGSMRSLQSLFTCCRVRWHKKRPVTSQNNDSQGDSGNAENHEDLADTDHTACDKVEKEHQLSAIDDRQTMLQQGYQMAVIPQQLSREEDAGCSFRSPSRSSSMEPQVSSVPSDVNSSDLDCTQNLETSNQVFSREEDACSSSMELQVSSIPSLSSSMDSVPDPTQELPKKKKGSMRRWQRTLFTCFGVRRKETVSRGSGQQ
ncbi:hypothetical protein AAFF_G00086120 [Aldrovandia affinis]|uniref:Protein kinase domain-containing protein n=1 Tax=Aldrovandia affinis TaxID=143900 RepID=A0AAD7WC51_9TELE|nr:hypothetical protein AAFF_G00086120 [Aldrovandia affinis]